jgi:F420H(2)-dependent quinone reductase
MASDQANPARAELWPKLVARFPTVGKYQATTTRQVPVFILTAT